MYANLEKSTIEDAVKTIADNLAAIQIILAELYRSIEQSRQTIPHDVEAIKSVFNEVLLAADEANFTAEGRSNASQKLVSLLRQFQDLLEQFRSRYRDFLRDEAYHNLQHKTLEIEFDVRFMVALDHLVPVEDFHSYFPNHCKGMLLLSEALEYGIRLSEDNDLSLFSENDWLESSKDIAMTMLDKLEASEVSKRLPASQDNLEELQSVIAYKNAARSILWQIDNFEKTASSSNEDLSQEEKLELIEEANQAMMEVWDLISQRQNSETDAQANL